MSNNDVFKSSRKMLNDGFEISITDPASPGVRRSEDKAERRMSHVTARHGTRGSNYDYHRRRGHDVFKL